MTIRAYDPVNLNLKQCKRLILQYQKTRDRKLFEIILLKYDRFIIFLVHKFRKSHYSLMGEELQDLYHVSILGFHNGILAIKKHHRLDKMNFRISSYIKRALRTEYDYKGKTFKGELSWEKDPMTEFAHELSSLSANVMINMKDFTDEEKELLKMRFIENRSLDAIGKEIGLTAMGVSKRITRLKESLKRAFKKERKDDNNERSLDESK
jgi:RNA polymerase sigma factor (sigma-70 family)